MDLGGGEEIDDGDDEKKAREQERGEPVVLEAKTTRLRPEPVPS